MAATSKPRRPKPAKAGSRPADALAAAGTAPERQEDVVPDKARAGKVPSLRAPGHRTFLGLAFGNLAGILDDQEPAGLSYLEIMADPRLAALGRQVFDELRRQFASDPASSDEEDAYRQRLENWADALEILLEEVLTELATLGPVQSGRGPAPESLL